MKDKKWVMIVFILSFILSAIFSGVSSYFSDFNVLFLIIILILVIIVGIIFDMVGVAAMSAKEAPFHAMSAKKIKGSTSAIFLLKNCNKVSSVCNDVIGDICGIVSGSLGAVLSVQLSNMGMNIILSSILVTSFVSALTVGGKAYFKIVAMKKCDLIIFRFAKIIHLIKHKN